MNEEAPILRTKCLRIIAESGAGLTGAEVADRMRWELCSVRARISELFALGKVALSRAPFTAAKHPQSGDGAS